MAAYYLQDVNGLQLQLPSEASSILTGNAAKWHWSFDPPGYTPRVNALERYNKDGAVIVSDRRVGERTFRCFADITIGENQGTIAQCDDQYREAEEYVAAFFNDDALPVYLYNSSSNVRCRVELAEWVHSYTEGMMFRHGRHSLVLKMLDLWEDSTGQTASSPTGGLSNGSTLAVNNTGRREAYPVLTVTALTDNVDFRITNNTTGEFTRVTSTAFLTGKSMIISSITGAITIDGVDQSPALADGSGFMTLAPGSNTLVYTSTEGAVELSVSWRRRFIS